MVNNRTGQRSTYRLMRSNYVFLHRSWLAPDLYYRPIFGEGICSWMMAESTECFKCGQQKTREALSNEEKHLISTNNKRECVCPCVGPLQGRPLDLEQRYLAQTYFERWECAPRSPFH
ncbi:hypothetical protein AVEN_58087-1 [Araneus ventricosus]|uniref:Uncharacterized protein n=1 Tax=Araneus ventricosus TaxID=182803 RepID=A0A4Y2VSL6_ARAVE|nr:hypothetical protein AVEN_58087-1 [Araneus ventricosus]